MNNKIKLSILLVLIVGLCFGQFKTDVPRIDFPQELEKMSALESRSLFDPSRFMMNHSFSMSMISSSGLSMGVGAYTNNMTFLLKDNLRLSTSFSLVQTSMPGSPESSGMLDGQVYYGATLEYRPTENTVLQLGFQKSPSYYYYNRPLYLDPGIR